MLGLTEAWVRGGAISVLALLAVLIARDAGRTASGKVTATFVAGVACYVLCSDPRIVDPHNLWITPLIAVCLGNNAVFWLAARALFRDDFRLRAGHAAVWLTFVALGAIGLYAPVASLSLIARIVFSLTSAGLVVASLGQALIGRRDDLVEARRRFRKVFVAAAALYIAAIIGVELALGGEPAPDLVNRANAIGLAVIATAFAVPLLGVRMDGIFAAQPFPPDAIPASPAPAIGAEDAKLLVALAQLMDHDRLYREADLTISALAQRLSVPENRLRLLINRGLGHRNFNDYLNAYRLKEVAGALGAPDQAEVSIATIAFDAGFGSLGPFNRAFKAAFGMTPTAFRRRQAAESDPS